MYPTPSKMKWHIDTGREGGRRCHQTPISSTLDAPCLTTEAPFLNDRPPWRQPRRKWMVSLVNSHTNTTRIGWHLWEIDLRFAPGLPPGWYRERGREALDDGCSVEAEGVAFERCAHPPAHNDLRTTNSQKCAAVPRRDRV